MLIWPTPKPAVLTAITILSEAFGEYAFVSAKMPARDRPERFIKVWRSGGGLDNIATDAARIVVECFAKDVGQSESMVTTAAVALRNAGGTTVTTTQGAVFVRGFENETIATDFDHPDLIEYERSQLSGILLIKAN